MPTCPNINLDSWKELVASVGKSEAYYLWDRYDGNVPQEEYTTAEIPTSRATAETLSKMKELAKKMGVDIQELSEYAKGRGLALGGVNGVADVMRNVVAVATGKEDVALTEELVHIATAMLEQTRPDIITQMISKIDRFKIYKKVLDTYSVKKDYQLPNGKPDIRKIKKEAVDKLIAELVVRDAQDITDFPELLEEEPRNFVQKLWDGIKDVIRMMYSSANINIFEEAATKIAAGELSREAFEKAKAEGKVTEGVFFQVEKNDAVDSVYDTVMSEHGKMNLVPEQLDVNGKVIKKRHYTYDGQEVDKSVTEKVKENQNMPERTGLDKKLDDQKRAWGDEGHIYIKNYISNNLIDENGYARETPLNKKISTNLNDDVVEKLDAFAKELIASYPKGTRFIIEKMVVNKKVKGMIGSTIDFMAIEPITKADGTKDAKVDVLDWKFTNINKSIADDVPWYKQDEWKEQMGEYSKILYSYGVKSTQLRKSRMIPFQANYLYAIPGDPESGLILSSIEIGKLDTLQETNLYLLPVPLNAESTGNKKVDALLESLRRWYDKLYKPGLSTEDKVKKGIRLNQISTAIRKLHLQLDFAPLASVGRTFLENAKETLTSFENIDYSKLSEEELRKKLGDLLEYQKSAEKFSNLDDVFLAYVSKENMTEEDKQVLDSLEKVAASTERMVDRILAVQREFVVQLALKEKITTEATKESVLNAEVEIGVFAKTLLEASKLSSKVIKLAANLLMNAKSLTERRINRLIDEYSKVLLPVEDEAKSKGVSAFDLIGRVENGDLKLIKKIDPKFYKQYNEAIAKKDKQFLLNNLDIEKYNILMEEFINQSVDTINKTEFSPIESDNIARKKFEIEKIKNKVNINLPTFNGYTDYNFRKLFRQAMLEEKNYSEDYKNMSPAAKDLWDFMVALNQKAIDMGYLQDRGLSFFPLMEASAIQRLMQSDSLLSEGKDLFKDSYTVKINEKQGYSKTDPETGQVERRIPRMFTRTDKDVKQLSRDLTRVGTLWIKSLLEYENARNMENTLLTLHSVEKNKGHIVVNENGDIVFESGVPKIDERTNKNADILEVIADDAIYGMRENLSSIGNIGISKISEKMKGDEETKEQKKVNIKKALNNGNKLTQALAVGLKALVALPNYFGYHFQTFINSGNLYRFREFEKNHAMITTGIGLTEIDKGLIDEFVPLNEDITKEKRRELAKKQSYIKWLGTWNFSDVMMITNAFPEKKLQLTNAKSIIDNSMVVDGAIVSIRQYLKAQDREARKGMSESQRKELERSFETRVAELKEKQSLPKVAKIENDLVVIPGVSEQELAKFRTKIVEYSRNLNGQMSDVNKADYRRDTILKSFMMFKNWIPKQISLRTLDIQKNAELDEWEYGRTRLFVKTWQQLGFTGIFRMRQIIQGTDEGIAIMNQMLEEKREAYFKKTGQQLEITEEEFYDLVRTQLSNQMKELGLLLGLMTMLIAAKAAVPPDDATALEKNRYKWWMKLMNKTSDEVAFYYNPISFEGTTSGSIIPSLSLLSKVEKVVWNFSKASYAVTMDDDELWEKTHTAKYFMDVIPVVSQFNKEVLPYVDPELAKELGIRVSAEARANR